MEDGLTFFFDSYALIEVYEKNPKYEKYSKVNVVTSYFHVYEVYYILIRNGYLKEEIADFFEKINTFCVGLKFEWIPEAVEFKRITNKREVSYADCIGYVIAKDLGIKFLTGDKEFEKLPNVEFVRK